MLPSEWECLEQRLSDHLRRQRILTDLTQEMLSRSRDAIAKSYDLLAQPIPKIWQWPKQ